MDTFEIKYNKAIHNDVEYDFDKLPENVVFNGNIFIFNKKLSILPNMSSWIVGGCFSCSCNNLTSLEGCPRKVCKDFSCSNNKLTSLEYCPEKIGGSFWCFSNELTSLKYCPKEVDGTFNCSRNNVETIDEWPEYIGGELYYANNPIKSIKEGVMPLKYLIEFYRKGLLNSKELLMKEFGVDSEEELNAYLLIMEKI